MLFVSLVVLIFALNVDATYGVTKLGPCTAQLDDGRIIDLTKLDNAKSPRNVTSGDFTYKYNPCSSFLCGPYDSAICQEATTGEFDYVLGDQNSVQFSINNENNLVMALSSTPKKSFLTCICDKTESFSFNNENPINTYYLTFRSPCCCPDGCANKPPTPISNCAAKLDDGSVIDLSSLDNPLSPLNASDDTYLYLFNPCTSIKCDKSDSAICQINKQSKPPLFFILGEENTVSYSMFNGSLVLFYNTTQSFRKSVLTCKCSQTDNFIFNREDKDAGTYYMTLESSCCCPNGCISPIKKLGPCTAKLNTGGLIDLTSLNYPNNPKIAKESDYSYKFNPCSPLKCGEYSDAGICQESPDGKIDYVLGEQSTVAFFLVNSEVVMTFTSSLAKISSITCICDQIEEFVFDKEYPSNTYHFIFRSPCCCPDGCKERPIPISNCAAKLPDGSVIDLSSLDDPGKPWISTNSDFYFFFNPCSSIPCGTNYSAICQSTRKGSFNYILGEQNQVEYSISSNNSLVLSYSTSISARNTILTCECSESEIFTFKKEENQTFTFFMTFASPCCCPNKCSKATGSHLKKVIFDN